jgi:glycosyltransferase involved in cell wall biosynthesis
MLISIITATYNSSETIMDCIGSVNSQTFPDIEQIIIDGASDDNTLELIKSVASKVVKIVSEADSGLYDAMNKGISEANGEIVGILNSDDIYLNDDTLSKVVEAFKSHQVDCVYADLFYVEKSDTNKIVRYWRTKEYVPGSFRRGWHPAHPAFFLRKSVYDKYGNFDLSFKLASDFELMLRVLEKHHISSFYLQEPLVKMRLGGETNKSIRNVFNQNIECITAFRKNGLDVSYLYPVYRLLPKLAQYFFK